MTGEVARSGPASFPTVEGAHTLDERLAATSPEVVLPRQLQLATDRAAWLGERLREQVEAEGVHGVVGDAYSITLDGRAIRTGEYARVLYEQERREREHVAALAERVARLGLSDRAEHRRYDAARAVAQGVRGALVALGYDVESRSEETRVLVRRAFEAAWQRQTGESTVAGDQ